MKAASGLTFMRCRLYKVNQTLKYSIFGKGHLCLLFNFSQTPIVSFLRFFFTVLFIYLSMYYYLHCQLNDQKWQCFPLPSISVSLAHSRCLCHRLLSVVQKHIKSKSLYPCCVSGQQNRSSRWIPPSYLLKCLSKGKAKVNKPFIMHVF